MKKAKIVFIIFLVFAGLIFLVTRHQSVASEFESPSGKYHVTISYRTYLAYLPSPPGSSSEKPCFVRIAGKDGRDYGAMPVPMLQMVEIEWLSAGASIKLVGEWDFERGSCYYWSEDGNRRIFVKTGD